MFEQPVLPVENKAVFGEVREAVLQAFASHRVEGFLKQVASSHLRIRSFESVLERGLLGEATARAYRSLSDGDQGQIRELYLSELEQVAPALRAKYLKVYAYY